MEGIEMSTQKPRVAVYCRVATADQLSIEQQRQSMRQFAKEKGFESPVEYLDNEQQGTAFEQLTADILNGKIQTVLDKDSLEPIDSREWLEGVKGLDVSVISKSEGYETD